MSPSVAFVVAKHAGRPVRRALGDGPRGAWVAAAAHAFLAPGRAGGELEPRKRARLLRRGFLPASHAIYDLDRNDPSEYVSDRQRELTQSVDGRAALLLGDKLAFSWMLERLDAPTPAVEAVVQQGRVLPFGGADEGDGWLPERLARSAVVVKPTRGGGGGGVLVLRLGAEGPTINDEPASWDDVVARVAALDDHIVSAHVPQAAYAAAIHPRSTNTLRLLTMIDAEGRPFLASAVHRFGTTRSLPVDNWSRGGLSVGVDLATGRLGSGAVYPRTGRVEWLTHHPDTGAAIAGATIPGWPEIVEGILALAGRAAFLPYVGWDVIVTDGGHVVLEGNHYSDVNLLQVHGPLLRDARVRDFYRRHGILR